MKARTRGRQQERINFVIIRREITEQKPDDKRERGKVTAAITKESGWLGERKKQTRKRSAWSRERKK